MSTFAWVKTMAGSIQSGAYVLTMPPPSPPSPPALETLPPWPCPAGVTKLTTFSKKRGSFSMSKAVNPIVATDTITPSTTIMSTIDNADPMDPAPSSIGALKPAGLPPLPPLSPLSDPRAIAHTLDGSEVMPGAIILTDKAFEDAIRRQYFEGVMVMAWKRDRAAWMATEGLSDEVRATFAFLDTTFGLLPMYGGSPTPPRSPSKRSKHSEAPEAPKSPEKLRKGHQPAPEVKDTTKIRVAAVAALLEELSPFREHRMKTLVAEVKHRDAFLHANYLTGFCKPTITLPVFDNGTTMHEISGADNIGIDEFNALVDEMNIKPLSAFQADRCSHFVLKVNGVIKAGLSVLFAKINGSLRLCASIEILVSNTPGGGTTLLNFLQGILSKRSGGVQYIVLQAALSKIAKNFWKQHATFNKHAHCFVFMMALLHADYLIAVDTVPMLIRL